jgi:hypothetical protein
MRFGFNESYCYCFFVEEVVLMALRVKRQRDSEFPKIKFIAGDAARHVARMPRKM